MSARGRRGRGSGSNTTTNGRALRNEPVAEPVVEAVMQVQPSQNFAILCKNYTALGGKPFYGTEDTLGVQTWFRSCERISEDLQLRDAIKRLLAPPQL